MSKVGKIRFIRRLNVLCYLLYIKVKWKKKNIGKISGCGIEVCKCFF